MMLNPDCVRTILLEVEKTKIGDRLKLHNLCEQLPEYEKDDLWYTCLKLQEAGFLHVITTTTLGSPMPVIIEIKDISYQGHEFLNSIRADANWGKVKDVAKKAGVFSLKMLGEIAQGVATAAITAALQSHQ